jgi:hypothetical protein
MELQIFDCPQGSEQWHTARAGIPTASMFSTVLAKGKGGGESVTRRKYLLTLIGERLTGRTEESYSNIHIERGKTMEEEARDLYAMVNDVEPQRVGFMRRGDAGCSPDSLLGADGLLEIKTKIPHLQIECLLSNRLPPEHVAQCQGQLWISGRQWLHFASYWPGLPLFVIRVERDENYIARLKVEVDCFLEELQAIKNQVVAYKRVA